MKLRKMKAEKHENYAIRRKHKVKVKKYKI